MLKVSVNLEHSICKITHLPQTLKVTWVMIHIGWWLNTREQYVDRFYVCDPNVNFRNILFILVTGHWSNLSLSHINLLSVVCYVAHWSGQWWPWSVLIVTWVDMSPYTNTIRVPVIVEVSQLMSANSKQLLCSFKPSAVSEERMFLLCLECCMNQSWHEQAFKGVTSNERGCLVLPLLGLPGHKWLSVLTGYCGCFCVLFS